MTTNAFIIRTDAGRVSTVRFDPTIRGSKERAAKEANMALRAWSLCAHVMGDNIRIEETLAY